MNEKTFLNNQKIEQKPIDNKPIEKTKEDEKMEQIAKELDKAFFAIKFYPVATKEEDMKEAKEKIIDIYRRENETVRQMVLYMFHENISASSELKTIHNFEYFKAKFPNIDPQQLRVNVYRSMFNFNGSIEGLIELIQTLGYFEGDDAAKILSYYMSFFSTIEVECMHILRNAIVETMGESKSPYALKCLLKYAAFTDNERLFQRITSSLLKWQTKIDSIKLTQKDKEKLKDELNKILSLQVQFSISNKIHYG